MSNRVSNNKLKNKDKLKITVLQLGSDASGVLADPSNFSDDSSVDGSD